MLTIVVTRMNKIKSSLALLRKIRFNYKVNIFRNKKWCQHIELDESYQLCPYLDTTDPRRR